MVDRGVTEQRRKQKQGGTDSACAGVRKERERERKRKDALRHIEIETFTQALFVCRITAWP